MPEQRNALPWYAGTLPRLAQALDFQVLGHSHPRLEQTARSAFARAGIHYEPSLDRVAQVATVYATDNSSTLWELGRTRPTIALNAPWYRRHVHHGLRFWSHAGLQVDDGQGLLREAQRLLGGGEGPTERADRLRVCLEVIPGVDGAQRAARLLSEDRWTTGSA
jgi:hypothetical protein